MEQACGELAYEIDTEIVEMLYEAAFRNADGTAKDLVEWSKTLPVGVNNYSCYFAY